MKKKYTNAGTENDHVKLLNEAYGLSYNDSKALLAQASQVHTVDDIPLLQLKRHLEVDSNAFKLNQIPISVHLDRDGPR